MSDVPAFSSRCPKYIQGISARCYSSYRCMIDRCHRPANTTFSRYGGRGIKVCKRWLPQKRNRYAGLYNFHADMGDPPDGHTLDRIDNDSGYTPRNCRWASFSDQQRNRGSYKSVHSYTPQQLAAELRRLPEDSLVSVILALVRP